MVSQPLYKKIKDMILQMAAAETEGERLPSVGELSSRLAVNPKQVERAYRELLEEGCLVRREDGSYSPVAGRFTTDIRKRELLQQFDRVVRQLGILSVQPEELEERVSVLMKRRQEF